MKQTEKRKKNGKKMEEISFNYFYWGPLLFRTNVSKQITDKLLRAGRKQKIMMQERFSRSHRKRILFF